MLFSRRLFAGFPGFQGRLGHQYARISTEVAKASSPIRAEDQERRKIIEKTIRIDHAGEYGAVRIYEGQLAVLGGTPSGKVIQDMKKTEDDHLTKMTELVVDRRVRPTALLPFWHLAGFALGAGSALLGKEAAMACTVAVEEVISEHYNDQIRTLLEKGYPEDELKEVLKKNRDEEGEHLQTGLDQGAEQAPFYQALSQVVKVGCRAAIWLSSRV